MQIINAYNSGQGASNGGCEIHLDSRHILKTETITGFPDQLDVRYETKNDQNFIPQSL